MLISLVAAMDRNRLIGRDNALPWRLPADLAHFKKTTMGKPVLMGRLTYESIGRPLPGRTNVIVSRDPDFLAEGCVVVNSINDAIAAAGDVDEVFIMGGASFYAQTLPLAGRMYLTIIDDTFAGDAWFPLYSEGGWLEVSREDHQPDEKNPHHYSFLILERKQK